MKIVWFALILIVLGALPSLSPAQTSPLPLAGLWDATVVVNGLAIPFRMEFSGEGSSIRGSFFNGQERVTSTSGRTDNRRNSDDNGAALILNFDEYATKLEATLKDGRLEGRYGNDARGYYPFEARRHSPPLPSKVEVPAISGLWEIQVKSPKGELAWRLIVQQTGAEVSAAVLRVDGDTGTLTGDYKDGKFVLSHFSGARPSLFEVIPQKDGTLEIIQNGKNHLTAVRPAEARAKGLPEPTDPFQHTKMKDPAQPLQFSFPDLNGHVVSNNDDRFRGKVILVAIGGSWCPNCHDEAPFLEELYRRFHQRGLEIVALSFEEGVQLKDPSRLRSFIKQYGIEFPVLLVGEPSELNERIPQAENLNSWPTTFFVGRDGLVRSIHTGFAGKASGEFHNKLREEITTLVERLLAEAPLRSTAAIISR